MIYYKPVKVTINVISLVNVIINMVIQHYRLFELIVIDRGILFISKFLFLLCYFLNIEKKPSTAFYLQTNGQMVRKNDTMEVYLAVFVNWEQKNYAWKLHKMALQLSDTFDLSSYMINSTHELVIKIDVSIQRLLFISKFVKASILYINNHVHHYKGILYMMIK